MKVKRKVGRPRKPKTEKRSSRLSVRVKGQLYRELIVAAAANKRTLSDEIIFRATAHEATMHELNRLQNQCIRLVNSAGEMSKALFNRKSLILTGCSMVELEEELRRRGWTRVMGIGGPAYLPPDVSPEWLGNNGFSSLEEVIERAADRAVEKNRP